MKKKVLFVIPTMRMGGAEKSIISLLKSLDKEKVDVDLFLFEAGGVLQSQLPEWVNVIEADIVTRAMILEFRYFIKELLKSGYIKESIIRTTWAIKAKFRKKIEFSWDRIKKYVPSVNGEYDVAIGYLEGVTDFFVIDKVNAKKKIGWIHTDLSKRGILLEEKAYYNKFDELVTISDICKGSIIDIMPEIEDKLKVVENIVIPEEVVEKSKNIVDDCQFGKGRIQLVSVGRLEYQKGIDIAARTAKILKDRNVVFLWHILGEGSIKGEIQRYIDDSHLEDFFVLEGQKDNPYPYMRMADIFVQPSRVEGKSIVLDEAKILGKAIVVTRYCSVDDQISDGETGLIADINPKSIAEKIEQLINDKDLRIALEKNAKSEINSSSKEIDKINQLLEIC